VIVKEALASGRLTVRGAVRELAEAATDAGTTSDALALAAALAQPWAGAVLSGADTVEQLESNLAAAELEPDKELLERLDVIREDPAAYWQTRAGLPWN